MAWARALHTPSVRARRAAARLGRDGAAAAAAGRARERRALGLAQRLLARLGGGGSRVGDVDGAVSQWVVVEQQLWWCLRGRRNAVGASGGARDEANSCIQYTPRLCRLLASGCTGAATGTTFATPGGGGTYIARFGVRWRCCQATRARRVLKPWTTGLPWSGRNVRHGAMCMRVQRAQPTTGNWRVWVARHTHAAPPALLLHIPPTMACCAAEGLANVMKP